MPSPRASQSFFVRLLKRPPPTNGCFPFCFALNPPKRVASKKAHPSASILSAGRPCVQQFNKFKQPFRTNSKNVPVTMLVCVLVRPTTQLPVVLFAGDTGIFFEGTPCFGGFEGNQEEHLHFGGPLKKMHPHGLVCKLQLKGCALLLDCCAPCLAACMLFACGFVRGGGRNL